MKNNQVAEELITFGDGRGLVGTMSLPAAAAGSESGTRDGTVALILFNAGVIARTGPHRLFVKLARQFAQAGHPALRFDLSGQGDSAPSEASTGFERQSVVDVRRAMDEMSTRTGVKRFVLFGICSGAVLSYAAALEDPRVVGCAMLDPYMYPTYKTHLRRVLVRLRESGIRRVVTGWIRKQVDNALRLARIPGVRVKAPKEAYNALGLQKPEQRVFAEGLQRLLTRRVALLMIFSGSALYTYNYEKQFDEGFRRYKLAGPIRVDFLPEVDHTVTELSAQVRRIGHLLAWIESILGSGTSRSSAYMEQL